MLFALRQGMNTNTKPQVSLFGASPDTGNQGVSALCYSVLDGLATRNINNICVYDHGRGKRRDSVTFNGNSHSFDRLGAIIGRRYYRPENFFQIALSARFGGLWNRNAKTICQSSAVLDVSGGDSFAEIYGPNRFRAITLPKQIALKAGRPLILLPQTYGPFVSVDAQQTAADLVSAAEQAWARDADSFSELKRLLGSRFDAGRHKLGVDMAFGLPACRPAVPVRNQKDKATGTNHGLHNPLIGFNVSGLLYNTPERSRDQFGLKGNYKTMILRTLRSLLSGTDADILLVPHVIVNKRDSECDLAACRAVQEELGYSEKRVRVIADPLNASELKWEIARTDWFCGTRMHSTIAALSSGVPTMALAYSMKTRGVFDSCDQGNEVVDLRDDGEREVCDRILDGWRRRHSTRESLAASLPAVLDQAMRQMDAIAQSITKAH